MRPLRKLVGRNRIHLANEAFQFCQYCHDAMVSAKNHLARGFR